MLPKGPIALAALRTTGVLALRLAVQAATLLVLARLLGAADFGAFAAISALAVLMGAMATFGTHLTLLRDLSNDSSRRGTTLPLALGTTALCGTMLLALYLALSFSWLAIPRIHPLVIVCFAISELVLQPFLVIVAMERHAEGRIARSQLILALPQALRLAVCTLLWLSDAPSPLTAYAIGHLAAVFIALVISRRTASQRWPSPRFWRVPDVRQWREHSGYALLGLTGTGPGELDKTLAARLLPLGLAGIYAVASRVIAALVIPVVAVVLSALPRLFRESESNDATLRKWLFVATAAYGTLAGAVVWHCAPLLDLLFGQEFKGVGQTAKWLALAVPAMSLRFAAMNILITLNWPWARVAIELFGLVLLGSLAWWLASAYSHWGLVLAVAASEWTIAVLGWCAVRWHYHAGNLPSGRSDLLT